MAGFSLKDKGERAWTLLQEPKKEEYVLSLNLFNFFIYSIGDNTQYIHLTKAGNVFSARF